MSGLDGVSAAKNVAMFATNMDVNACFLYNNGDKASARNTALPPNHSAFWRSEPMAQGTITELVYKFHGPKDRCAYCADPAGTIDHTIPRSFIERNFRAVMRLQLVKVQSCMTCNVLAGDELDFTFSERKHRIFVKSKRRGGKLLQTGNWTPEELRVLGPGLRRFMERANTDAKALRRRLAFLESPHWPPGVPDNLWPDGDGE